MHKWFTLRRKNAAINLLLSFIVMLLSGWIADAVNGATVFPWALQSWLLCDPKHPPLWWSISWPLFFSICWCVVVVILYQRRKTFLPVEVLHPGKLDEVKASEVLVLTMSNAAWVLTMDTDEDKQRLQLSFEPTEKQRNGGQISQQLPLLENLNDALLQMAELKNPYYAWEQLLRALQGHKEKLQRVYLIGSNGDWGTAKRFDECRMLIHYYFPALKIDRFISKSANFESLDDLLCEYRKIIATEHRHLNELMIDVTGGTKVISIAAAIVTLEHTEIEFQYVETSGDKQIRTFNVGGGRESGEF